MGIGREKTINLNRAVFLDRDGIINQSVVRDGRPYPPRSLAELQYVDQIEKTLSQLKRQGFLLIVVTNQPDVARGTQSQAEVESIHTDMRSRLPIDRIYTCFHDDKDGCDCRKPLPGLLLRAAGELKIDLAQSFMIGDRWRDVDAGQLAGCKTIFVDYGYTESLRAQPDFVIGAVSELTQVVV